MSTVARTLMASLVAALLPGAALGAPEAPAAVSLDAEAFPLSIPLSRSVSPEKRSLLLMALKEQHARLYKASSLLELGAGDVPLREEVLATKHLATYYGSIRVGPDDAPFRVLVDTGSSEFWVPSSECRSAICMRHKRYPIHGDERKLDHQMDVKYLSGSLKGDMVYARVRLGDVTVKHQVVGLGRVVDIDLLKDVDWDGIMGLAYPNPSLSRQGVIPLFDTIINQKVLSKKGLSNQFAYWLDDRGGALTLGGANCELLKDSKTACVDAFKFVPVTERTYWTITIKDVTVKYPGEQEMTGFCPEGGCKSIVDTGTYLTYVPQDMASRMLRPLNGCGSHKGQPDITFHFHTGDTEDPVSITLRPVDYILKFEVDGRQDCVQGISPDQDTLVTLGQTFLRSVYTIFDRDSDRIGFARLPRKGFHAINEKTRKHLHERPSRKEHHHHHKHKHHHKKKKHHHHRHKSLDFLEERGTAEPSSVLEEYARMALDEDDMPANEHWSEF